MESISIELEARNSSLNCRRSLHIYNDRDLFGQVQAQVAFGRKECPGRRLCRRSRGPGASEVESAAAPRRRGGAAVEYGVDAASAARNRLSFTGLTGGLRGQNYT
jgi:hypothetical protein